MNRRARILILILIPALALSLGCNLASVRRRLGTPASPTPVVTEEMTFPLTPTAMEEVLPTPTPAAPGVTPTSLPSPPPETPPLPPCGDGVCDYHEWQNPDLCPQDCPPGTVYVGSVELDMEELQQLQAAVDQGHQPWRLDPLEVARDEGEELGFDPANDVYELLSLVEMGEGSGTGEAEVLVIHGEHLYIIHLIQPVRPGLGGIWTINDVREVL